MSSDFKIQNPGCGCDCLGDCGIASDDFEQGAGNPHGWDVVSGAWAIDDIGSEGVLKCTSTGIILAPEPYVWPSGGHDQQAGISVQHEDDREYGIVLNSNAAGTSYVSVEVRYDASGDCEKFGIYTDSGTVYEIYIGNQGTSNPVLLWAKRSGDQVVGILTFNDGLPGQREVRIEATSASSEVRCGLISAGNTSGTFIAFESFLMERISGSEACIEEEVTACESYFWEESHSATFGCGWNYSSWSGGTTTGDFEEVIWDKVLPNEDYRINYFVSVSNEGVSRIIVDYQDSDNYHCIEADNLGTLGSVTFRLIKRSGGTDSVLDSDTVFASSAHADSISYIEVCKSTNTISCRPTIAAANLSSSTTFFNTKEVGFGSGDQSASPSSGKTKALNPATMRILTCDC